MFKICPRCLQQQFINDFYLSINTLPEKVIFLHFNFCKPKEKMRNILFEGIARTICCFFFFFFYLLQSTTRAYMYKQLKREQISRFVWTTSKECCPAGFTTWSYFFGAAYVNYWIYSRKDYKGYNATLLCEIN